MDVLNVVPDYTYVLSIKIKYTCRDIVTVKSMLLRDQSISI